MLKSGTSTDDFNRKIFVINALFIFDIGKNNVLNNLNECQLIKPFINNLVYFNYSNLQIIFIDGS